MQTTTKTRTCKAFNANATCQCVVLSQVAAGFVFHHANSYYDATTNCMVVVCSRMDRFPEFDKQAAEGGRTFVVSSPSCNDCFLSRCTTVLSALPAQTELTAWRVMQCSAPCSCLRFQSPNPVEVMNACIVSHLSAFAAAWSSLVKTVHFTALHLFCLIVTLWFTTVPKGETSKGFGSNPLECLQASHFEQPVLVISPAAVSDSFSSPITTVPVLW